MVRRTQLPATAQNITEDGFDKTLGYVRCSWVADGQQCRYPGSMSHSTGQGGWLCRLHWECSDPVAGADIVQASLDYKRPTRAEIDAKHQAQADAKCAELGLKTIADKQAWLRANAGKVFKRFPLRPRIPGDDDEEVAA